MATISDVARRAGVSTATVSRVLNGTRVGTGLAEAVRTAVAELNYSPNRTARSLRRQHSDVIALVIPDIENPFFTSLARSVEDRAHAAGFSVVLCNTDEDPAKEARYLAIAASENMAGVLLAPTSAAPMVADLLERGRAVIAIDRDTKAPLDHVLFNDRELGRLATKRLLDLGLRRIGCLAGPEHLSTAQERAEGWRLAHEEAGVRFDERLLVHSSFRPEGGFEAMTALLTSRIDGVVATNNLLGVGALRALAGQAGTDTPPVKVSMIGAPPFAFMPVPNLLVTPVSPAAMAERATAMLLERIAKPAAENIHGVSRLPHLCQ